MLVLELHKKYGSVIRITPNDLSYQEPNAWKEIMGHRKAGQQENDKEFYYRQPSLENIVGAYKDKHNMMRRSLSAAFSAQAMENQQPLIQTYINLFIQRMHENVAKGNTVDMVSWFNWTTFDIIGDLAFGEPFGCLESSSMHPWIAQLFDSVSFQVFGSELSRYPLIGAILPKLLPPKFAKAKEARGQFAAEKVDRRIARGERPDLIGAMLKKKEHFTDREVWNNADALIVAGSETTATTLSATTYYLAKHPDIQAKLAAEVRGAFASEEDINIHSVQKLPYMLAVLNEALRIFPPAPTALPRSTPPEGASICGEFIPGGTGLHIFQWALFHNPELWADPEEYVPERWLGTDPRYEKDEREALKPFSFGPRDCIGKNLAYTEMRIIMSRLIWNFEWTLVDDGVSPTWADNQDIHLLWHKPALNIKLKERVVSN
ncbi:hypothetical protein N0V82_007374 [Gnomoniopsis sp. IMI 355080]|nr:hypothetical protein N0V82_007374 [Gnomoniopsis sp. IMI 355080]